MSSEDENERAEPELPDSPPKKNEPGADDTVVFELPDGFENDETGALVERAQRGEVKALNELFERYHAVMVELARRRLGPRLRLKEDPDDLAQTTFREATRDFSSYTYRGEGSLLRWLIQILHNKIRDKAEFYSAGKRDTSLEKPLDRDSERGAESGPIREPVSPDLSVTRQVQRDERFDILRTALDRLTPEYRQAITLVFFQGLSLKEAGQRMGDRSDAAVRMMLRRAEGKLRTLLSGQTDDGSMDLRKLR